jgi:hypothetical protein
MAARTILASENQSVLVAVLKGRMPLLAAAKGVRQLGSLVSSFRAASAADRVQFARTIGPTVLFDTSLVPAL